MFSEEDYSYKKITLVYGYTLTLYFVGDRDSSVQLSTPQTVFYVLDLIYSSLPVFLCILF